jgi:predicted membrane protein
MRYKYGQNIIFFILAAISALALLSEHPFVSIVFFVLAIAFVIYENQIYDYVRSA